MEMLETTGTLRHSAGSRDNLRTWPTALDSLIIGGPARMVSYVTDSTCLDSFPESKLTGSRSIMFFHQLHRNRGELQRERS